MHKQIQQIISNAMKGINARILFGTVEGVNPLNVKVDQRFYLPEVLLVVPESLQKVILSTTDTTDTSEEIKQYTLRQGLAVGDNLIIINLGQKYLILDRVGDPNDVITITKQ